MDTPFDRLDIVMLFADIFDKSKSEINRLLAGGGLYINNNRIANNRLLDIETDLLHGKFCVLRIGKKNVKLIKMTINDDMSINLKST